MSTSRLLFGHCHLHTRLSVDKTRESLHFTLNTLTQLWSDMHLFAFDDDLHGLHSLSDPTTRHNKRNSFAEKRYTTIIIPFPHQPMGRKFPLISPLDE